MKEKIKLAIAVLIIAAMAATGGLLRLHQGQIQEQQPDGSWKCADTEIREIVNRKPSEIFLGSNDFDPTFWTIASTEYSIEEGTIYDPNTWEVPDSFIRSLCESGRICQTMGHQGQWKTVSDVSLKRLCRLCGQEVSMLNESGREKTR